MQRLDGRHSGERTVRELDKTKKCFSCQSIEDTVLLKRAPPPLLHTHTSARALKAPEGCEVNRCPSCLAPGGRGGSTRESRALKARSVRVRRRRGCLEISTGPGVVKQRKMDDFQHGRGVFPIFLSRPSSGHSSARTGPNCPFSWRDGRAKNTPVHALWNTRPLFTCLLTPPDLFTDPPGQSRKHTSLKITLV